MLPKIAGMNVEVKVDVECGYQSISVSAWLILKGSFFSPPKTELEKHTHLTTLLRACVCVCARARASVSVFVGIARKSYNRLII